MVRVFAHRGANRKVTENTRAAFRLARILGADGVELDARLAADGVLVVHHDPRWSSNLPGAGRRRGERVAATPSPQRPAAVPTLAQALDACAGLVVNVELKVDAPDDRPLLVAGLVEVLAERARGGDAVIVSSFDAEILNVLETLSPGLSSAWLTSAPVTARQLDGLAGRKVSGIHPHASVTDAALVDAARARRMAVRPWTVNDPDEMIRLARLGVDAVITDVPDVALAVLGRSGPAVTS